MTGYGQRTIIFCLLLTAFCLLPSAFCLAQTAPASQENQVTEENEAPLPGDWAPELLYAVLTSPNPEASDALHRSAFAAGPALVPQLQAALKDDRTAEFAAQSLAFIGGEKALETLSRLASDPRDLNLRRFFYGALGEFRTDEAAQVLLDVLARSDSEPDRTVTEAAILALTVRSDLSLVPRLREIESKIKDVVIRDDLDNALDVIQLRAKYLATPEGKKAGVSLERAVRTYFVPALESPPDSTLPPPKAPTRSARPCKPPAARPAQARPPVTVEIQNLTFSPGKSRALARVIFEDPSAKASYDIVLEKQLGDWAIASVWLGTEVEKTPPAP